MSALARAWRRRFAGIGVVVAASLGATAGPANAAGPEFFGTNLQTLGDVVYSAQGGVLDSLRANRMVIDRQQIGWDQVETTPPTAGAQGCAGHTYDWDNPSKSVTDATIGSYAAKGLRIAPVFRFTPWWVPTPDASKPGGSDVFPPSAYDDFGCMIGSFARRYGTGGTYWSSHPNVPYRPTLSYELWNEINLKEYAWNGDPDPATYAAMAKVAAPIIRAMKPGAIVLGDLAYQENEVPDYVPRLGAAGGLGALDAMGYHPYAPDAKETIRLVQHLRRQLADAGYGAMPIYANEAGQEAVVTNPDGSSTPSRAPAAHGYDHFPSDAARAANLAFAGEALAASDCGVEQFLPYSVSGLEREGAKLTEAYMGLFRPTGVPTETALALGRASKRWAARFDAGGPGSPAPLHLCGDGASPDATVLRIDGTFTSAAPGCVTLHATYDGNPLEAVALRLFGPSGAQVAVQETNAFGDATACIPYGTPIDGFSAAGDLSGAGRTGKVLCDVAGVGCPQGATLNPGSGSLSAADATGGRRAGSAGPAPTPKPTSSCKWESNAKMLAFTPKRAGRAAVARLQLKVECETAPADAQVRFRILVRQPPSRREREFRTVWLQNGVTRIVTLSGALKTGHVVVVRHRPAPGSSVPSLRDTVTLRVTPRRVKNR